MKSLKLTVLLTLLTGILGIMGRQFGGNNGMFLMLVFSLGFNFISYWFSDRIVLLMYGAKPVSEQHAPILYSIVRKLVKSQGMPVPKICMIDTTTPNAFATGRNSQNAAIAVTTGIMDILNRDELEGVLAHELAHVKNRDILVNTIVSSIAGVILLIANMVKWTMIFGGDRRDSDSNEGGGLIQMLFMIVLAPIAATLVQLAVSRLREFDADESGAKISGKPLSLASALLKLENRAQFGTLSQEATATTAHLFIVNPLKGSKQIFTSLFSTHPSIEERVKRLNELAANINNI